MTPHPYQQNYLDKIVERFKEFPRILVVSPTGSGKTCMFSWLSGMFLKDGKRVLILVDQDELVKQTAKKIREIVGVEADIEQAENRASLESMIIVGSQQTLYREKRLERWPRDHFDLVIADEADKSISPTWLKVLNHFGSAKCVGFTATPHRTDKRNLGEFYQDVIEQENLFSLIKKGFLSPIAVKMLPISLDLSGRGNGKDFTDNEADEIITPHLEEIAKAIQEHAAFRRTLVFLPLVKTCERFTQIARDVGLAADFVHGADPLRDEKISSFKRYEFDVLANSMLLTRGVDIPEVDCIVPCRPTKSITLYFQIVGRGTRLAAGKTECLLLDFLYQAGKRLVCRPAHLIARTDEEAEQITRIATDPAAAGLPADVAAQMDLMTLADTATSQREQALRKKLEENRNKKAKTISAEEFALQHHAMDVAEYEPVMPWESQGVTEKQSKWLEKAGIDIETIKGKGHASKLLSLYFANKPVQLASYAQRKIMAKLGHPTPWQATAAEARQFFAARNQPKEAQLI
jgi:superfamily II DNA or RNA helicase